MRMARRRKPLLSTVRKAQRGPSARMEEEEATIKLLKERNRLRGATSRMDPNSSQPSSK